MLIPVLKLVKNYFMHDILLENTFCVLFWIFIWNEFWPNMSSKFLRKSLRINLPGQSYNLGFCLGQIGSDCWIFSVYSRAGIGQYQWSLISNAILTWQILYQGFLWFTWLRLANHIRRCWVLILKTMIRISLTKLFINEPN